MTFSGGLIDLILFGVLQGNAKTNWLMVPLVGAGYFAVYFLLFRLLIQKRNYLTPGREADSTETRLYTRADYAARADYNEKKKTVGSAGTAEDKHALSRQILEGLGGRDNVTSLDCCATRLRVSVTDSGKVSKEILTATGAAGVIVKGSGVQVIYGPRVAVLKSELEEYMAAENPAET
jgi:PTS system D-glucosamine-specific IIC component